MEILPHFYLTKINFPCFFVVDGAVSVLPRAVLPAHVDVGERVAEAGGRAALRHRRLPPPRNGTGARDPLHPGTRRRTPSHSTN